MENISLEKIWPEWKIERRIGKGSYGAVYKAVRQENGFNSYSAIKVITIPQDPSEIDSLRSEGLDINQSITYLREMVNDFVNEIKLMQSFKGTPNIVSIEDYKVVSKTNEIGWDIYIRMELLTSFNEYTCDKKLSEQDVIKLGCDICTALEMCESRNIIHRDIKPENIFINDFGYFKLGDFGIARTLANLTNGMSSKGTPLYMAPEVFNSSRYDCRVDIYSLGIVMYKLLNNDLLPFIENRDQLMNPYAKSEALERRRSGEIMKPPCEASPAMANLVLRACSYNPENRFASASELKTALISVQNATYKIPSFDPDATTSVKHKSQNLDSTTSSRQKVQDFDATTSVRHAPQSQINNTANTFAAKKKSKTPVIIASILAAVVIIVGGGIFAYPHITNIFDGELASNKENPNEKQDQTVKYSKSDTEQIFSIISVAETIVNSDIEGAIAKIQTGLVTYPKSDDLQDKLDEYTERLSAQIKADTLDKAAELADSCDYVAAMAMIEIARKDFPDDADYISAHDKYNQAYMASVKTDALRSADILAKNNDIVGAITTIENAISTIGKDIDLEQKLTTYQSAYTKDICNQVDTLASNRKYNDAVTLIEKALKIVPGNVDLTDKLNSVKDMQPVLLSSMKPFNGEFEWNNDTTPQDPFGNTYNDYTLICYKKELLADGAFDAGSAYREYYSEYYINNKYEALTLKIAPYIYTQEESSSYLEVYVDDKKIFTSTEICRKSQPESYELDVSNGSYLKIVAKVFSGYSPHNSAIILSDATLWPAK